AIEIDHAIEGPTLTDPSVDGLPLAFPCRPIGRRYRAVLQTTTRERKNGPAEDLQARLMRISDIQLQARYQLWCGHRIAHGGNPSRVKDIVDPFQYNDYAGT